MSQLEEQNNGEKPKRVSKFTDEVRNLFFSFIIILEPKTF